MKTRLKVLVSAYACSPNQGSEPGVGWGFVIELAQYHELWVIVEEEKFRDDIERYFLKHPDCAKTIHFYFLRKKRNRMLRKLWPPSYYWYYRAWHVRALDLARRLHAEVKFDIAHQLTMVGFREPGYLWKLGIPFVWGPIGGMGLFPWRFLGVVGAFGGLYYLAYNIINSWQMMVSSRPKLAANIAGNGLIAMNSENQRWIKKRFSQDSEICVPVGPPTATTKTANRRLPDEPVRIVWSGLHIPRKALNLGLKALAALPDDIEWEMHILGAGILTEKWKRLALRLRIHSKCRFLGQVSRDEVLRVMEASHIHLFTSLREGTPTVIVEACSVGVPTVCLDLSGMMDMVDDSSGIKVSAVNPAEAVSGLSNAVGRLARNEKLRYELACGALRCANAFGWSQKAAVLDHIYQDKIGQAETVIE